MGLAGCGGMRSATESLVVFGIWGLSRDGFQRWYFVDATSMSLIGEARMRLLWWMGSRGFCCRLREGVLYSGLMGTLGWRCSLMMAFLGGLVLRETLKGLHKRSNRFSLAL